MASVRRYDGYRFLHWFNRCARIFQLDPLYLLDEIDSKYDFTEEKHLASVLKRLVGDFMDPFYEKNDGSKHDDAEYIYRDLFLWCVLTYRLDMAKIFLIRIKARICSALVASKILKAVSDYAPDQASKKALRGNADDFEMHAIEFVRYAYAKDKHLACELIMRQINVYGGVTCLQMAFAADNKRFLYEDACQALLTNIWYDKIDPVRERPTLIINMITLGFSQLAISIYNKCSGDDYSKIKQKTAVC